MTLLKPGRAIAAGAVASVLGLTVMWAMPGLSLPFGWRVKAAAQSQEPTARSVKLTARRYRFEPARIEVFVDDLVSVELHTEDIAHSVTIDAYRIAKRVGPGKPVTFEFRADQAGTFPFYCNLLIEDGCRQMRGELIVKRR